MTTFKRICIETRTFGDPESVTQETVTLERGREYLTSREENGRVMVFTTYWFYAPLEIFAGAVRFT